MASVITIDRNDDPQPSGTPEQIREQELSGYERKFGKDATPEEEQEILLGQLMGESRDVMQMMDTASMIFEHQGTLQGMDDGDRSLAISMLEQRASDYEIPGISFEAEFGSSKAYLSDQSDRNEGKLTTLLQWAEQAVRSSYQILGYGLKRSGVFISRSKKTVDGIEARLTKLDGLMKSRKSEKNRIYFNKTKLALLVEDYDVNTSPAGAVSSFVGTIYGILDDYMDALRTISVRADTDLNKGDGAEIDLEAYKKVVDDLLEDLESKFKSKETLIGNRYVKVNKSAKPSKAISLAIDRPDPKSVIGKFRPMDALSNSAVESQRATLRSGVLKKMYKVMDDTAEDMKKISEFSSLSKQKGDKPDGKVPDKKDIADLSKFLTETIKELTEGIFVLSDMVYETVDAAVSLLEDSVTVTQIHGETAED